MVWACSCYAYFFSATGGGGCGLWGAFAMVFKSGTTGKGLWLCNLLTAC